MPFIEHVTRARDRRGDRLGHCRRARVIVFAAQQRDFAARRIDLLDILARIPIDAVEIHVTLINARAGLGVIPPVLAPVHFRTVRRVEAIGVARAQFAAVDGRVVQEIVVAARRIGRAFQADDAGKLVLIAGRELEHDGAAHRAAEKRRPFESERKPDRADDGDIGVRRQAEFLQPPAIRRRRAAVIRHVEGYDAKPPGDRGVIHQVTELPAVVTRRVQAKSGIPRPASSTKIRCCSPAMSIVM